MTHTPVSSTAAPSPVAQHPQAKSASEPTPWSQPPVPALPVRARFCPSPTGTPHVGLARTALFNWAFARHHGGTFVFRIEDTDAARDSQESYLAIVEAMTWLGLDWDEGPNVGGPHGPYRQSERGPIYREITAELLAAGHLYESHSTTEDVTGRHLAAGRDPKLGYDNYDRTPDPALVAAAAQAGRPPVLRLRMPERDITFDDLVRGPITFPAGSVPDPVLVRGGGDPLYTLVNPVDDALMGITHVLRGEDLLPSTPRQIALYETLIAIGRASVVPRFGHLPFVTGESNRKLSKRDPQSNLFQYRDDGFIPEGMVNYLALLGWSLSEDRDIFSPAELVAAFDGHRISGNPARFDRRKAESINGAHLRALPADDFADRLQGYLIARGVLPVDVPPDTRELLLRAAPLVQERSALLSEAALMLDFLFTPDAEFTVDPAAAAKVLTPAVVPVLTAAIEAVEQSTQFAAEPLEAALRAALLDGLGLKPKVAFAPVRVAVTGRTISPPLYESMELLGRDLTLSRLRRALASPPV